MSKSFLIFHISFRFYDWIIVSNGRECGKCTYDKNEAYVCNMDYLHSVV